MNAQPSNHRKIPATMATQHPDNACPAFFTNQRFINAKDEVEECFRCFSDLGLQEYMWDWEGKFVDEAVIDRLFNEYHEYFKKKQIGKDLFLTFRLPNIWIESSHKLPRAFMNMISAENAAKTYGFHSPPLFEVILPMTTKAEQLIYLQKTFTKIARATEEIFDMKSALTTIEVIPLFEEFEIIADCKNILREYVDFVRGMGHELKYMRVFTARSDTAMNAGFLPAKMAVKLALHLYHQFGQEQGIEMHPWVGGGSLPFRGGINPENIENCINEHHGVATLTVQSAFRYDYPLEDVKTAIKKMNEQIPKNAQKPETFSKEEEEAIKRFNKEAALIYRPVVESLADVINEVAGKLPSHRERVQHIGLFGYSRGLGSVQLPRAIKFTGALYSLGIPPELIGSGRALQLAHEMGILPLIHKACPYLREDFIHAGHYFNRENLDLLIKDPAVAGATRSQAGQTIHQDAELIQKHLNIQIGPQKPHHIIHRNLTSTIYQKLLLEEDFSKEALAAAEIRKSLG